MIQDLDELPFMATDFLEELQLKHGKNVTAYLVSSRGCYKNCSFCSIAAYFDMFEGCRMRYRSVKSVFEEIKYLYQNYNIRKFCFWDDNFIIPGKRGIERCRELVELIKSLPEKISLELETTRPNYKIKKTVVIDQEKWIRVKNTHEAIISQRDFDIVQKLAGIDTRISTGEGEVYLFSGLVLCEKCGDTLIRRTVVRNHTRYTYYGCYDRKRTIKCKGVVIREDDLEQAVLTSIQKHIQTLLDIDKLLKHVDEMPLLKRETDALTELVASAKNELLRYQNLNESLYRDYLEGIVDQDEYLDLRNIYSTNEERLHKSIQELDRKKQQVLNKTSSYQRCIELFREFGNIQKLDRKTLVMLISHISVVSKKKIKICFTYQDEFDDMCYLIQKMKGEHEIWQG